MIPPCDPTILETNPQFKKLYQNLTTTLLNPDGSTRAHDAQPERKAALEKRVLRRLAFDPDSELPDDVSTSALGATEVNASTDENLGPAQSRDNIAIVTLYLDSSRSQLDLDNDARDDVDALSLLAPNIDAFYSDLPLLMPPFSRILSSLTHDLRLIADAGIATSNNAPSTETSRPRQRSRQSMAKFAPQVPLSSQLRERIQRLRQTQLSDLPAARARMAATAAEVLAMRTAVLERMVTLLERAKHGALARATKAKAEHLAMVAQGVEGKLSVMQLEISNALHTPEVTTALGRYREHLQHVRARLEERRVKAQEELDAYAAADSDASRRVGSGPVREIARRYGALLKEMEDVRMEIQRLDS
ncbi:conserved hypothetical protein [Aspergillus terreus NIH2624]|uniref:HAUS augmin-like complex subunit 4 n=1 Tax=Aspergillus terreus (strain NIH 2624 / FGSC A1156) TaxID=341663 RepID=Q0CQM3_ASPTN|nr:uncharacterized protein ATEG_04011 [Aspergillus terreus NIH2624]EAU35813.1 conserved hypothetical protein [Aspergillus terreus NIH2624]